mmetsp:Transcript_6029/g.22800  ORF Transcript_6029/g.22800 Transcript_6029/m.22800 type:complete len:496 (-) Transcript_6029:80-1567(-)
MSGAEARLLGVVAKFERDCFLPSNSFTLEFCRFNDWLVLKSRNEGFSDFLDKSLSWEWEVDDIGCVCWIGEPKEFLGDQYICKTQQLSTACLSLLPASLYQHLPFASSGEITRRIPLLSAFANTLHSKQIPPKSILSQIFAQQKCYTANIKQNRIMRTNSATRRIFVPETTNRRQASQPTYVPRNTSHQHHNKRAPIRLHSKNKVIQQHSQKLIDTERKRVETKAVQEARQRELQLAEKARDMMRFWTQTDSLPRQAIGGDTTPKEQVLDTLSDISSVPATRGEVFPRGGKRIVPRPESAEIPIVGGSRFYDPREEDASSIISQGHLQAPRREIPSPFRATTRERSLREADVPLGNRAPKRLHADVVSCLSSGSMTNRTISNQKTNTKNHTKKGTPLVNGVSDSPFPEEKRGTSEPTQFSNRQHDHQVTPLERSREEAESFESIVTRYNQMIQQEKQFHQARIQEENERHSSRLLNLKQAMREALADQQQLEDST